MNIGIVGLGLIGGSLAIDFKALQTHTILGVSRRLETCNRAIAQGIVDQASPELSLMAQADIIFLCTPLAALLPTVKALLPYLSSDAILTDVGSVKGAVVEALTPLWPNFVGGHPMAGTAEHGLEAAQANLFVDCAYVLTPTETTPIRITEQVADLARALQARVYHCDPHDHDRAVAWISHLPVMVSASLLAACLSEPDKTVRELAQMLASSGFRDTSRVGGGNPELGVMMARYNQAELGRSLSTYRDQLERLITIVEQGDWASLEHLLKKTQDARPDFL